MRKDYLESEESSFPEINQSESKRTLYLALGSTLTFILYSIIVLDSVGKCFRLEDGPNSLGLTFTYNLEMVQEFFELRNQDELGCYRDFLKVWDVLFVVIYTSMYYFWVMYLFDKKKVFLAVPIIVMLADWGENFAEILMIDSYLDSNSISESLVSLGSWINMVKWIFLSLTYLIILGGIVAKVKSFFTKIESF